MKRSRMLLFISYEIMRHLRNEGVKDVFITNILQELPEQILTKIEQEGMLPPIEPHRCVGDLDLGVPEWEPE